MDSEAFLACLLKVPSIPTAYLSPDGRWVAFDWQRRHANRDVFAIATTGLHQPLALTCTPEATRIKSWARDSLSVIIAEDHNGDERYRLFRVRLAEPKLMIPLTEENPPYFLRGGALSPDGDALYYGANYDFTSGQTLEPTWMYRHDLTNGNRAVVARPTRPDWSEPFLNSAGTHLLYSRRDRHPAGRQYHLVDLRSGEDQEWIHLGERVKVVARWFSDGDHILVIAEGSHENPAGHTRLGICTRESPEVRWLVDDPARTIQGAWPDRDGPVIVNEIRAAVHRPVLIDPLRGSETPFPTMPGNLLPLGRTPDGDWVAIHYAANQPDELIRFPAGAPDGSESVSLTHTCDVAPVSLGQLAAAEDIRWRSVDGLEIQGWLYRARTNRGQAVIYIHGGPSMHMEDRFHPLIQYLVSRGFNVLVPNYRGSTGFGLSFRELIKEDGWGGREQDDIAAGARMLIERGLAVPGKVGVTGTSFGGYSAWVLATRCPREWIAAAVPVCGMTDLVVDYNTTRPDLRPYSAEMMGGTPEELPARYHERSPIHFIENIQADLMIVQGARDPNVTPENTRLVVSELKRCGIAHELLVFEDEGHGILKPANQLRLYRRMADFFEHSFSTPT